MATKPITDENFETEVIKAEKPVRVDFWAEVGDPTHFFVSGVIHTKFSDLVNKLGLYLKKFQLR